MQKNINDYIITKKLPSNPIYKNYEGHHKLQPSEKCKIQSVNSKDIPQCYKNLIKDGPLTFDFPMIQLKQIFINPNKTNELVFIQKIQKYDIPTIQISLEKKIILLLHIAFAVPYILYYGLIHDFTFQKMSFDKSRLLIHSFIKNKSKQMTNQDIETQINTNNFQVAHFCQQRHLLSLHYLQDRTIIGQLFSQKQKKIHDKKAYLNILNQKDINNKTQINFQFQKDKGLIRYTNIFLQAVLHPILIVSEKQYILDQHQRKIGYQDLNSCINYFTKDVSTFLYKFQQAKQQNQQRLSQQQSQQQAGQINYINIVDKKNQTYPQKLIGIIHSQMINQNKIVFKFIGTAVLVSPNLLMTCAHNIQKLVDGNLCTVESAEKLKFILNKEQYEVESYKIPKKYTENIEKQNERRKYDYALVKLKDNIKMDAYIEPVQNYTKTEKQVSIKGFYMNDLKVIHSKIVSANQMRIEKDNIQYIPNNQSTLKGFSGGPLFVVFADKFKYEDTNLIQICRHSKPQEKSNQSQGLNKQIVSSDQKYDFKIYFVIGIHNSGDGIHSYAHYFKQETISQFAQWEKQLTGKIVTFQNILNFNKVVNLQSQYKIFQNKLKDIQFNENQKIYFNKINKKLDFSKQSTIGFITDAKYFNENAIDRKKLTHQQLNKILNDMSSFTEAQRHNNLAFLYHARNYQNWMPQFSRYKNYDGMFNLFIYVSNRILLFFQKASPKYPTYIVRGKQKKYKDFVEIYSQIKKKSATRQYVLKKIQIQILKLAEDIPFILQQMEMNKNFKKIIDWQVTLLKELDRVFDSNLNLPGLFAKKIYNIPKLSLFLFIAKQMVIKIADIDQSLWDFLHILNYLISIITKKLMRISYQSMKETMYSFVWSVRQLIQYPQIKKQLVLFDPNHPNFMKQQCRQKQQQIQKAIQEQILGQFGNSFLVNCYNLFLKSDQN